MVETYKLSNGITVLLSQVNTSDTAAVLVGVNVGSNNETEKEHGIAHFFEHMCIKGTKTKSNKELVELIDSLGLISNAATAKEWTQYYLTGEAEEIDNMIEINADMFLNSIFPEEELEKEKRVILQEISREKDDPMSEGLIGIIKMLFKGTKMEHRALGTTESVQSLSREDFINFLDKHYVSGNVVISISGKFNKEKVLEKLEEVFKDAKKGEHVPQKKITPNKIENSHESLVKESLEQMSITIGGYSTPPNIKDVYSFEVCNSILGNLEMSSRLFIKVREELGACYYVRSFIMDDINSIFYIGIGIDGKKLEEAMNAIAEECKKMKNENVTEEELERAKSILLSENALANERNLDRVDNNFVEYLRFGSVEERESYKKNINAVTAEDVKEAANKILDGEKMVVCYIGNTKVDEKITQDFLKNLS